MSGGLKSFLKKTDPWYQRLMSRNGHVQWPAYVLSTLEEKYHLTPKEMLRLRYIRQRISNGKYPIDSLFIYDWISASEKNISVRSSEDIYGNLDLLLFKGNILWDGSVNLKRMNCVTLFK